MPIVESEVGLSKVPTFLKSGTHWGDPLYSTDVLDDVSGPQNNSKDNLLRRNKHIISVLLESKLSF